MSRIKARIALLHHVGIGNLGDEASFAAVLQNVKSRWPDAEFIAFTLNPSRTHTLFGIPSFPIHRDCTKHPIAGVAQPARRAKLCKYPFLLAILRAGKAVTIRWPRILSQEFLHLVRSYRALQSVNLLVISGGGQLRDRTFGAWDFPYTIWKWTALAKLRNARCYFINLGAGPLKTAAGRFFISQALKSSDYTSFRDGRSQELIRSLGWNGRSTVHPDCVYAFSPNTFLPSIRAVRGSRMTVGVSPMQVYWSKDPKVYSNLIKELGHLGGWLACNGYRLSLFSTENPGDGDSIKDLQQAVLSHAAGANIECPMIDGFERLLACMSKLDYVVTCRYHGAVFAHLMNIPVLAIAHHPKVSSLMAGIGHPEFCLDIDTFTSEALQQAFKHLVKHSEDMRQRMREYSASNRAELMAQFDLLFPTGPEATASPMHTQKQVSTT